MRQCILFIICVGVLVLISCRSNKSTATSTTTKTETSAPVVEMSQAPTGGPVVTEGNPTEINGPRKGNLANDLVETVNVPVSDDQAPQIEVLQKEAENPEPMPEVNADFTVDYIMGKFDPAKHTDFQLIPSKYADNDSRYLRKDVLRAYIKMYNAAQKAGFKLVIISATRNFENQKRIWENKWTGKTPLEGGIKGNEIVSEEDRALKILKYSSMPGTSRHHWGTDIDINSLENTYFESGDGKKLYTWMQENASKFGFCQTYSTLGSDRKTGYQEEKWHWTYMPVSRRLTHIAKSKMRDEYITGFLGAEQAINIQIVKNYILGISPACM
jgi:zinc D-Ala-D-Ala carboxypeptidase